MNWTVPTGGTGSVVSPVTDATARPCPARRTAVLVCRKAMVVA